MTDTTPEFDIVEETGETCHTCYDKSDPMYWEKILANLNAGETKRAISPPTDVEAPHWTSDFTTGTIQMPTWSNLAANEETEEEVEELAPVYLDHVASDAIASITRTGGGMDDIISYPNNDGSWTTMPFYDNPVYDEVMRSMHCLPSTSTFVPAPIPAPTPIPVSMSTLNPKAPTFVPTTPTPIQVTVVSRKSWSSCDQSGQWSSCDPSYSYDPSFQFVSDPSAHYMCDPSGQWSSCDPSYQYVCDPSGQWSSCDPSYQYTCDSSVPNYYMPMSDAMWEDMPEAPPTTFDEGFCEAHTLAGWGTIPYTIVNEMFCSEHSYPVVVDTHNMSYSYNSTIETKLSTLFRVESYDPFTIHIGLCRFDSALVEGTAIESVSFPHGLPIFKLAEPYIMCYGRDKEDDNVLIQFYGEVYDLETVYAVIPKDVQVPAIAADNKTVEIRDNGVLYPVVPTSDSESDEVSEEEDVSEDEVSEEEDVSEDEVSEDVSEEDEVSEDVSEEDEVSEDEVSEDVSEDVSEEDEVSEDVSEDVSEEELRKYYAELPLQDFFNLDAEIQGAVYTIFDQPNQTKLCASAHIITHLGKALETWSHMNKTTEERKDELDVYKTAVLECFDEMFDML